ncbi:hypothetical protein SRHO_G00267180 [Serrasalmus rhombeus]
MRPDITLEAEERFQSYPPWATVMCFALVIVAMLPLPAVFIACHFNLLSDGSNKLSVSYRKGCMMKDMSNLEEQDETRFILNKNLIGSRSPPQRPYRPPPRPGRRQSPC